jgi:hypothetical protein
MSVKNLFKMLINLPIQHQFQGMLKRSTLFLKRLLAILTLATAGAGVCIAQSFSFVALGDMPYGNQNQTYLSYRNLIEMINRSQPKFSIHVGDFKSGSSLCSDREFAEQLKHFAMFDAGVVFTPGDNDWTDCYRLNNGGYDPLERLRSIRQDFFKPEISLGKSPLRLVSQPQIHSDFDEYVENQRWVMNEVLFVTVHIVGSNNNFESRDVEAIKEFFERDAANIAWIRSAFDLAQQKKYKAIVFAFQADVLISRSMWEDFPSWSGFRNSIGQTLLPLAKDWAKPVLLIHGDGHKYHFDQPFKLKGAVIPNVTRLEVPGASDVRAVKVTIDLEKEKVFSTELLKP